MPNVECQMPLATTRTSAASEPRERSAPAKRRARERVGESEGRSPSVITDRALADTGVQTMFDVFAAEIEKRTSEASEPRERSAPAQRRARERVGESEGRNPSVRMTTRMLIHTGIAVLAGGALMAQTGSQPAGPNWGQPSGDQGGTRFSTLKQIDTANVANLERAWTFHTQSGRFAGAPMVVDSVMYFSAPNGVYAVDAVTGTQIWKYAPAAAPATAPTPAAAAPGSRDGRPAAADRRCRARQWAAPASR